MNEPDIDVVIIGAGVCGIYQLHRLRELGLKTIILEAGEGIGGTWYWNRYPGARFDSESYSYAYSFSKELLQEWNWKEHFSAQPDTLRYLEYVVEKFDLAEQIQLGARVKSAMFNETGCYWSLELENGKRVTTRFLCTAIGLFSAPTAPKLDGIDKFRGESFHTYNWPKEEVTLTDKRVAVVGTGATGVQVISEIASKVESLTVFQRRPNWCAPLNNLVITDEEQSKIKAEYDEIFRICNETPGAFLHRPIEGFFDATPEERKAFWEERYNQMGFGIWLGNYSEILHSHEANKEFSDFIAEKIRARVDDPEVAEKLIPKDHGFGARRVPLETRYYEAYNHDHVRLVDVAQSKIKRVTETGIETDDAFFEFDVIIYATGFDAVTGAFDKIDFRGIDGATLRDKWSEDPITYLGLMTSGFPNMLTLAGPQSASVGTNFPRAIEDAVNWATDFIVYLYDNKITYFNAQEHAEEEWGNHVSEFYGTFLAGSTSSWFTGYNSNVEGHDTSKVRHLVYFGGGPQYRQRLSEVAENGYDGIELKSI